MSHRPHPTPRDYSRTPVNVYWEITRACALACRHCRAEASLTPDPQQLSFEEGKALLQQIKDFGDPLPQLILTGGDPLHHPYLFAIIDEAHRLGISVSVTPAATPALTREVLEDFVEHHVDGLGLSLDGSTAERHDSIRGIHGTFARTLLAMRWAQELHMPLQVNTLVSAETLDDIRTGRRTDALDLRNRPHRPVHRRHHRSALVPPRGTRTDAL